MNYNYIYNNYKFNKEKLLKNNFQELDNKYILRKDINNEFYLIIEVTKETIETKIFERDFEEEYLPYKKIINQIPTAKYLQEETENIMNNLISKIFDSSNIKTSLIEYISKKYKIVPETPWEDNPEYYTIKTKNSKKWFGLIMNIKKSLLSDTSDEIINIINIKLEPSEIEKLVDNIHFFNAYHMNKKYWISIVLDNKLNINKLYELIDKSYSLVEKKRNDKWIIPVQASYFDIEEYFQVGEIVDWKQSAKIEVGDILYMYISVPYKKILYKCVAVETDIPFIFSTNKKMNMMMRIKTLEKYDKEPITLELMKLHNVTTVRGPRNIPESLEREINIYYGDDVNET